jgi:hypothetical protein
MHIIIIIILIIIIIINADKDVEKTLILCL